MSPIKFRLNFIGLEEMLFKEFQDGHLGDHLGYQNGMILVVLNIYVTEMPPIKFPLNQT